MEASHGSSALEMVENGIGNTLNLHNKFKSEEWTMGRLIDCDERGRTYIGRYVQHNNCPK